MALKIKILNGKLENETFLIEDRCKVGRTSGDLIIEDPKISSSHAQFYRDDRTKKWMINDLNSSNGIKVDGKVHMNVELTEGLVIRLGSTNIEILQSDLLPSKENIPEKEEIENSTSLDSQKNNTEISDIIKKYIQKLNDSKVQSEFKNFKLLKNPIRFKIKSGNLKGLSWTLVGLPFVFETNPIFDIENMEQELKLFTLSYIDDKIEFTTDYSDIVNVNDQEKGNCFINSGDKISILDTDIEVKI